ncbi:TatD family hydrolase [Patescibacteria group bacterium]|nr:TatD family hydrolase [Patescibacteria group bacterium]MBU1473096.1 TatD family hydrolase [Patescibacteria group bacterium]MBU2459633.1 TatD family hydrolase [Patescibacteria group bacterium]MBU2544464.1 TatD family hydrolase [Patescibacteria group bacterium]
MYIDTHCHLNFKEYDQDRAMVIGNAKKAGVKKFINPGCDLYFSKTAIELSQKYPGVVYAAVGFHPYEAVHEPDISKLESFLRTNNYEPRTIIAIGECGLDYHMYKGELAAGRKDVQKILFEEQLLLALKHNLPVIIHCREAFADCFHVLDNLPKMPAGVFHCFSGGLQDLRMIKEYGMYVGIDGNVTYSKQLQMIVPHIPLEMLLLETDAPYLTPVPHRGSRNEPKYIPLIARRAAELKNIPVKTIEETVMRNARALFGLP